VYFEKIARRRLDPCHPRCVAGAKISVLMSAKTHSELLFEEYLRSLPVEFAHEPEIAGRSKRPDYRVEIDDRPHWFEVKELADPECKPTGGYDPTPPFEEKIDQARKKFTEFKDDCCVLVLHGCKSIYRRPMLQEIVSAAFGKRILVEPRCGQTLADEPYRFKFHGKAKLRPGANTTISAIIILQHFQVESRWVEAFYRIRRRFEVGEEVGPFAYAEEFERMKDLQNEIEFENSVRAVVLKNPYARIPFPGPLFLGPLDQLWGSKESSGWYTLIAMGNTLERLRARERPVPFLVL
jgi:hypothetical protein